MSAIFISHSGHDRAVAAEMLAWLRERGHTSIFLDFDPEHGIPAGRNWERELYASLEACRAVIVLCSVASMASRWCFHEIASARARGIPTFAVRIEDCMPAEILREVHWVDLFADRQQALDQLWRGLLDHGLDPAEIFVWDRDRYRERGPYPGLGAFDRDDAGVYFGREGAIREVVSELHRQSAQGAGRVVLILGASGSGKSSLMRAGVLPRLAREPARWLTLDPFTPQGALGPLPRLARVLADKNAAHDLRDVYAELTAAASGSPPDAASLNRMVELLRLEQDRPDATVVLAVDQAEQLLTREAAAPYHQFLALLRAALEKRGSPLVLLATLRSADLGAWQEHPALRGMGGGAVTVGPMAAEGVRRIIELPARVHALDLETGLLDAIVADIGTNPDSLPLLAFTLRELYETCGRATQRLTLADYRERLGGVARSIERKAEEICPAAPDAAEEQALRHLFVGLARPSEDRGHVRRLLRRADVDTLIDPLVERFVAAGLLVVDRAPPEDVPILAVAHEALFRAWPRLRGWLDAARLDNATAERVRAAAQRWQAAGAPSDDLLLPRGRALEEGRELLTSATVPIDDIRPYIAASLDADRRRSEEETRRARRERDARREAHRERLDRLSTQSRLEIEDGNATLGLLLALEGAVDSGDAPKAAGRLEAALLRAIFALRERRILAHGSPVNRALLAPDGERILTLDRDGVARLWNTRNGTLGHVLDAHPAQLLAGAFCPNGRLVATASSDGTVRLLDAADGSLRHSFAGHVGAVHDLAFAPDGRTLVTACVDGTARLFDTSTGVIRSSLSHADSALYAAAFAPDGGTVMTAGADHAACLWDPRNGIRRVRLEGHDAPIFGAAFTHNGGSLATTSWDRTARLWHVATGACYATLRGHEGGVEAVAFAPDDRLLLTGSDDGTIRLWSVADGAPVATLTGHAGQVFDALFSADGRCVVSASADGTVRLWEVPGGRLLATLGGHLGSVWRLALHDRTLVSAGEDGTARVWDIRAGTSAAILSPAAGAVQSALFSPDGGQIATATEQGRIALFDAADGRLQACLDAHEGAVWGLAYAPGGDLLASAANDGTLRLWNSRTGACRRTLHGHEDVVGHHVAIAPDGRRIASCGNLGAAIWTPDDDGPVIRLGGHNALLRQVLFTPDGARLVTASDDGTARLWDAATGAPLARLAAQRAAVVALAISPDGCRIASASLDGTIALFDAVHGTLERVLRGHRDQVWHVAFAADGEHVVSAGHDNRAIIWDAASGRALATLAGHRGRVILAVFDPMGRLVLTASWDRTARLWHAATGQCVAVLGGHADRLHSAVFSAAGRRVLTASEDGTAHLHDLPVGPADEWRAHARRVAPRTLSDEERALFA